MKVYLSQICQMDSVDIQQCVVGTPEEAEVVVIGHTIYAPTGRHHISDKLWLPRMLEAIEYCSRPENRPKVVTLGNYQ